MHKKINIWHVYLNDKKDITLSMNRYDDGKIYKVVSDQTTDVYYGSTCSTLYDRYARHTHYYRIGRACSIKRILKYDDSKIVLVENFPCNNKDELLRRERYYIENNDCVNIQVPLRTVKEYYDDYQQEIIAQKKEYRAVNKEKIKLSSKKYREENKEAINKHKNEKINCECGGKYTNANRTVHQRTDKHQTWVNIG